MDVIKAKTAEAVTEAYKKAGVSEKRIANMNSKFVQIPDNFKIEGFTFLDLEIDKKVLKAVPHFVLKGGTTLPIGQLFANYCDADAKASKITKKGNPIDYSGKYLVVNKHKVNSFAKNMSEAEFVAFCTGKEFIAGEAQDYPQYNGFVDGVITFHDTPEEAQAAITPKSYRPVSIKA